MEGAALTFEVLALLGDEEAGEGAVVPPAQVLVEALHDGAELFQVRLGWRVGTGPTEDQGNHQGRQAFHARDATSRWAERTRAVVWSALPR
ncbi:hypothetical protein KH5H1_37710 [Corallococcus caeni]|nr:hypothetical protein KH5H1_37710 [Corallococcus sp. KH5-1]